MTKQSIHFIALAALAAAVCAAAPLALAKDTNKVAAASTRPSVKLDFNVGNIKASAKGDVAVVGKNYELKKGETVIKTTPSGKQVNVPCQAVKEHGNKAGHLEDEEEETE